MKNVKRTFSVFLAFIVLFGGLFQGINVNAAVSIALPFEQNFDVTSWTSKFPEGSVIGDSVGLGAHNPDEWKSGNYSSGAVWPYAKMVDAEHGVSLQIDSNGTKAANTQVYLQFTNFAELNQNFLVYEFEARADSTKIPKQYQARDQTNAWATFLTLDAGGAIKVDGKATGKTYQPNQWYKVKVILNQKDKKFVVYLDGERLNVAGNLPGTWVSIQYLYFVLNANVGNVDAMYFDNIKLSTMTPEAFAIDVDNVQPADEAVNVPVSTDMLISFNNDLALGAITSANVLVNGEAGHVVAVEGVAENPKQIRIKFKTPLAANTPQVITLINVYDVYGQSLQDYPLYFITGDADGSVPAPAASPYLQMPYYYDFDKWADGVTFNDADKIGDGLGRSGLLANNPDNWKFQNYGPAGVWAYKTKVDAQHGASLEIHSKGQADAGPTIYVGDGAGVNINNNYIAIEFEARAKNVTMKKDYQIRGWGTATSSNFEVALSFDKASDPSATTAPILVDGQDTGATYEPNRWYNVKILLNHVNRSYVVYLDGQRLNKTGIINDGTDRWTKLAMMYFSLRSKDLQADDNNLDASLFDGMYLDNVKISEVTAAAAPAFDNSVISPIDGATNVSVDTTMTVGITNELSAILPKPENILVNNESGWVSSIEYAGPKQFKINFVGPLDPNYIFTVTLTGIKDLYDQLLPDASFTFTTGDGVVPPYLIGKPTFMKFDPLAAEGQQETAISTLQAGLVKNQVRVRNINGTNSNVTIAMAVYEDNMLKEIKYKKAIVPEHTTAYIAVDPVTVSEFALDITKVKVFVWHEFGSMIPMSTVTSLDLQGVN